MSRVAIRWPGVLFLIGLLFALALPASAQPANEGRFSGYEEMRATLDDLIAERRIADLMSSFGNADGMSREEWFGLQGRVRLLYPEPLASSAVLIRQDMKNGFVQDLIAYWQADRYL